MSYAIPDVEDVVSVASSLGVHLGPDEAVVYRTYWEALIGIGTREGEKVLA